MISEKMRPLVNNNSAIRAMFEEGNKLREKFGEENVFDFSLGNPNVPAPREVNEAIIEIVSKEDSGSIHGYMNNAGYEDVRQAIAQSINKKHQT
ncbi:MAG: pyridoxal phosphate-dependent aminotransferase, partial [Eubacteriales bacterium]|nr:pyridoxal phosphate-dependent aminotransferase [Eubacteriales bacterium]